MASYQNGYTKYHMDILQSTLPINMIMLHKEDLRNFYCRQNAYGGHGFIGLTSALCNHCDSVILAIYIAL